jgi:hypothetical protein
METINKHHPVSNYQREILFKVEDKKTHHMQIMKFEHTKHSLIRSSQRGIGNSKISLALVYGQAYFKQGFNYYVLGEKDIPEYLSKEKSHLKNIVVVVSGDSNQVITSYKSSNPFKHVRIKSKELYKN